MLADVFSLLLADVSCVALGLIAHECAPFLLEGSGKSLLNPAKIPHPLKANSDHMWPCERDRHVKTCCSVVSILVQKEILFG